MQTRVPSRVPSFEAEAFLCDESPLARFGCSSMSGASTRPNSAPTTPNPTRKESLDLVSIGTSKRSMSSIGRMSTVAAGLSERMGDATAFMTAAERARWNFKRHKTIDHIQCDSQDSFCPRNRRPSLPHEQVLTTISSLEKQQSDVQRGLKINPKGCRSSTYRVSHISRND